MSKKKLRSEQAVSAPGPLTIGGRTLLVRAPTPADLLACRKWVRREWAKQQPAEAGLTSAGLAGLSAADRKVLLTAYGQAKAKAPRRDPTEQEVTDLVTSPAGAAYMVWLAARAECPDLTLEAVRALVTEANVDDVLAAFDAATGVDEGEDGGEGEADPKAPGAGSCSPSSPATTPG